MIGRLLQYLFVVVLAIGVVLYYYYGTFDPCTMLDMELSTMEQMPLFGMNAAEMKADECIEALPTEWWENITAFWDDRPAND